MGQEDFLQPITAFLRVSKSAFATGISPLKGIRKEQ
jgi:hypothetical protein